MRVISVKTLALLIAAALIALPAAWAGKVKPLNIERLTETAETIFEGECIGVKTGKDEETGFLATWYTFNVIEGIKGEVGETLTFKQYGGSDQETTLHVPTVKYQVGERIILFLYGASKIGFTSSVGMHQGKFAINEAEETGSKFVSNGLPALLLFENMQNTASTLTASGVQAKGAARLRSDRIERTDFIRLVRDVMKKQAKTTQAQ